MNYKIPDDEIENFISVFWQMMREIEERTDPEKDKLNKILVDGAYNILNRSGIHSGSSKWATKLKQQNNKN